YSGVHYDYDQRGNLVRKTRKGETTDYHWNGYNQLVKIENRNGSTEYRYDPLGRRTAKIRNGETTIYHWQEDTLAIESTNGQNTHYLFEPGTFEPLAQFQTASPIGIEREDKPAEPYSYDPETDPLLKIPPEPQEQSEAQPDLVYYQLDHLGTPIAAHNVKGEAVWTAEYEAWGRIRNETVSDGLKANIPFRFQGQYYDEESGLHYNRFRYYDPEIGRFVSQDLIGLRGGMNLFEYAPNPILWVDPLGLSSFSCNKLTVCGCKEILKSENVIIGKHGDMKKIGGLKDSHHIYQDAAVRNIPNYKYNHAIAISIQGRNPDGSTKNTPHYRANRAQDNSSKAGILGAETVVAYNSLRAAGLSAKAAKCATLEARKYLIGLGANAGSSTNQLSRRRK
ncbi:MAG: RHS domain-containing protein, partial [Neisseria sp.]